MINVFLSIIAMVLAGCHSSSALDKDVKRNMNKPSATELFKKFDLNKDGKLSQDEIKGPLADDFERLDKNVDGFLTQEEIKADKKERHNVGNGHRKDRQTEIHSNPNIKALPVNTTHFITDNFIGDIETKVVSLNGIDTLSYVFETKSRAIEHDMGPWCPNNISDSDEKGGIWFKNDKLYDVSGQFIANLGEFYKDNKWKLYDKDGRINVTESKLACLAAAKPKVEKEYHNYCVQCSPEYFQEQTTTFVIPVNPQYITSPQRKVRGALGVAFNGVKFDSPAPVNAILAAHTIAPLDDHGGHVNPHGGYHYHAATGSTKEVEQKTSHSSMIGYALDGFAIYANSDDELSVSNALDECGGHEDSDLGYHYHAGKAEKNQVIKCLHGLAGYAEVNE